MSDLEEQVRAEAAAIAAAPTIDPLPPIGRCCWCGRLASNLTWVEAIGNHERYKCDTCMGFHHE